MGNAPSSMMTTPPWTQVRASLISTSAQRELRSTDLPFEPGKQQTMLHLDFEVSDPEAEIERAVALGVTVASHQPQDGRAHRADWSSASP
jgi:hypothetical protein